MRVSQGVRRWIAFVAPLLLVLALTASVDAASPEPSAAPIRPPANIQAWLDGEFITPDAPPGGVLEAGFSFWDTRHQEFFDLGGAEGVYVLMHPGSGSAPSEASIRADFPGHVVADIVVPEGGPGDVEVGMLVNACVSGSGCVDQRAPFEIAGTGPPTGALPKELVTAEILPLVGDTVVGREFPVAVNVQPRGLWDVSALPLPDHLLVVARHPGGAELSTGELRPGTTPGTPYTGRLTIPESGDVEIAVAMPLELGGSREIAGSAIERTVIEDGRETSAPGAPASGPAGPLPSGGGPTGISPASTTGEIPVAVWILGIGALVVGGLLLLGRLLRDL